MALIPHNLKKMKFITLNREIHKWVGIGLSVFILIITITGFVLIHKKDWKWLKQIEVANVLIPGWYAEEMAKKGKEIKALNFIPSAEAAGMVAIASTKTGFMRLEGHSWKATPSPMEGVETTSLLLSASQWLAGTHRGLFRSTDAGQSWEAIQIEPLALKNQPMENDHLGKNHHLEVKTLAQSPDNPAVIWMGTKMGVYRSQDEGGHWDNLTDLLPLQEKAREVTTIAFVPQDPGTVLLGTHNGLYRYDQSQNQMVALNIEGMARLASVRQPQMTLDKYMDKLHTGKLFGDKLWTLYDLTALSLMLFVGTGLYIWIYPKSVKRRKEREQAKLAAMKAATQHT